MDRSGLRIRESGEGINVALHVQARARSSRIAGMHAGALKLKVAAPPVDNAANEEIVRYFSSLLSLPKSRIRLVSGLKSSDKILRIEGLSLDEFLAIAEIERTSSSDPDGRR